MSKEQMKAVGVAPGRKAVELVKHPMPRIDHPRQVLFRTLEVGICGTDKEICSFVYGSPPDGFDYLVLGHEALGEVVDAGSEVTKFRPGDLVIPSVRRPCPHEHCVPCRQDLQDFCFTGDFTERGIKMTHGFMTEFVVEEEKYLNKVDAGLRDVGVLVEPLTVAEKALSQVWKVQDRLPWLNPQADPGQPGQGRTAVVLGAGPVGILGAMLLRTKGFKTFIYSRSREPNPKADVAHAIGVPYISALDVSVEELSNRVGQIDLVYEALGVAPISYDVMRILGMNGVFVFTGIPSPKPPVPVNADEIMRNVVLQNQVILGTVNADREAFENAAKDLAEFRRQWPGALKDLISGRHRLEDFNDLLLGGRPGIKNIIALD